MTIILSTNTNVWNNKLHLKVDKKNAYHKYKAIEENPKNTQQREKKKKEKKN